MVPIKEALTFDDVTLAPISMTETPPLKILNFSSISINLYADLALYPSTFDCLT